LKSVALQLNKTIHINTSIHLPCTYFSCAQTTISESGNAESKI